MLGVKVVGDVPDVEGGASLTVTPDACVAHLHVRSVAVKLSPVPRHRSRAGHDNLFSLGAATGAQGNDDDHDPRLRRRVLASELMDAVESTPPDMRRLRVVPRQLREEPMYVSSCSPGATIRSFGPTALSPEEEIRSRPRIRQPGLRRH